MTLWTQSVPSIYLNLTSSAANGNFEILYSLITLHICFYSNIVIYKGDPSEEKDIVRVPALLEWDVVSQKMAWNVIILLGGGFALAEACKVCHICMICVLDLI